MLDASCRSFCTSWRAAALALATLAFASSASAQATLITGLGGTAGYGSSCLGPNDDESSDVVDLRPAFPSGLRFFDRTHTSGYVNTNGNVSFSGPVSTYTPDPFPVADQPMIAPYWADVDIRNLAFMGGPSCDFFDDASICHSPSENGVWWWMEPGRMIVTWDRVGYYDCNNDHRMSFQLILTAAAAAEGSCVGSGDFDVEFRYNRCEWTTGDASGGSGGFGGTPAQAGFDAGNLRDFVMIMGSRTPTIHTALCTGSNVGETGVWRFQIRSGVVVCPGAGDACETGMPGVCAAGRMQCVGMGTECVPEIESSAERCDALDNDCDGTADEGDGLCASGQVCDRGVCVEPCFEGGCSDGQVCAGGRCVDPGCETLECPDGQRCVDGHCAAACDGVMCPGGLSCRGGRCLDLCARLTCDDCTVCDEGMCVPRCSFAACAAGETCTSSGACIESACDGVTCGSGEVCRGGSCVDACSGAVCPRGESCMHGECVAAALPDGGPPRPRDGGSTPPEDTDGGVVAPYDGGGCTTIDCRELSGRHRGGCGCRVAGAATHMPQRGALAVCAIALLLGVARRRRRIVRRR